MAGDGERTIYDRIANTVVGAICGVIIWGLSWVVVSLVFRRSQDTTALEWLFSLQGIGTCIGGGAIAGLLLGKHFFSMVESVLAWFGD